MSLLLESISESADTDGEESQNYEHDLQSLAWQNIEIDENKMAALSRVIEEIAKSTDNLPGQIIEAAEAVFKISSGINWLQNHKEDFERIIGRASILVIGLRQSYKKSRYPSLWPSPKLTIVVDYLIETVHRIHKLMKRNFKNLPERIFKAYVVRDLGKFKKYEQKLDFVVEDLEKLGDIKIDEVLLEVLRNKAQHHDDAELSEEPARGGSLEKENTQRRADTQELLIEGSNSQRKASAATKPTYREMKSEEENEVDLTKSKALEKIKNKVNNDSEIQHSKDALRSDNKGKKKMATIDDDVEEWSSEQGFAANRAAPTKARKRLSQISDYELSTNEDVPVSVITMGPTKEMKPATTPKHRQNVRRETAPPQLPVSTSGVFIANYGPGKVDSRDVGNIKESTFSNVGNDNSENHFQPRPKPTYATEEKKPAMTPKQNLLRQETAPSQLPGSTSGVSIINYGAGTVTSSDIGNIKKSTFSNVGNNNAKNYFQPRPKPTYTTKKKKHAMTSKQDVREQMAPAQLPVSTSGVSINNYGSMTVARSDVGNIKNSESEHSWTTTCWIAAENALQHARKNILSVSEVFERWKIPKSEYVVHAGFDEPLIKSGVGYLEQIHVFVITEVDATSPLLSDLGRLFSPFSSTLFTESSSYRLPVFKDDGSVWEFDELVYFTASKLADGGTSAKNPLTVISLSQTSSLSDSTAGFSQSTSGSGDGEGEKNMERRLKQGKERDMGDKDEGNKDDEGPSDNPEDPPGDQDGITDELAEISFRVTAGIHLNNRNTFQTFTMHGRLTIKTTPPTQNPARCSERFVQFTKLIVGTEPTTDVAYKLFHLRVVVDSHEENAEIDVIKPRGTPDSNGEERQFSSTQSGWTFGMTTDLSLELLRPQAALTGTAMATNREIAGSEKMRKLSAITEYQNYGKVRWGFNIDDVNFQKWGITMPEHDLPTVRFQFIGDSNKPAPPSPPPKYMDIVVTSIWSMISPSELKSPWLHKLFHSTTNGSGNAQTTISYSNLFQIVALKAEPSDLPKLSHYRANVKIKSGVSEPPEVERQAVDSVCVTPAVVDDLEKISSFNLPMIAKFKLSDIWNPVLENRIANGKRSATTEQEIIPLAYEKLKTALTTVQPWPDTKKTPNKVQTEADEMARDAWDDSCNALKVSVDPSRKALKMIKERISQFRETLKNMAVHHVPTHYGFVDISMIKISTPSTIVKLKDKNRELVAKLRERFYYRDPHDVLMTDKNGMYRNSIIQNLLNSHWFAKENSHQRSHDFEGKTMLPLVTLALILTAISCAIDVWETGEKSLREFDRITYWPRYNKHLKKLTAWAAFTAKPSSVELAGGHDLCAELLEELLRNARACLPIVAQQAADTTEADDEAAMLAEFEADFS